MTSCAINNSTRVPNTPARIETGKNEKLASTSPLDTAAPLKQVAKTSEQQQKLDTCLSNIIKQNLGQLSGDRQRTERAATEKDGGRTITTGQSKSQGETDAPRLTGQERKQAAGTEQGKAKGETDTPRLTGQERGQTAGAEQGKARGHENETHEHLEGNGHIKHHQGTSEPGMGGCIPEGSIPDSGIITTGGDLTLEVRGLLQGAFNAATGLMNDDLRTQGLLPTSNGSITVSAATLATTGNDAPVDWVTIELRDRNNPSLIISSQTALIQRDGDVANPDTNSSTLHFSDVPAGDYFVTLSHRNHLDVMTTLPVNLSADSTLIDFTNPATLVGHEAAINSNGAAMLWAGDANGNNNVIADGPDNDLNAILTTVLTDPTNPGMDLSAAVSGYKNADVNLDGMTTFTGANSDASLVSSNAKQPGTNASGSANFVLNGTVPTGTPVAVSAPKTTITPPDPALLKSLWF